MVPNRAKYLRCIYHHFWRYLYLKEISPFNDHCSHHIETSQLICSGNQLTGFYMMGILVVKRLIMKLLLDYFGHDRYLFKVKTMIFPILLLLHVSRLYQANPFHTTSLFLYPLKTSKNLCFSDVFRGYRKRPVAWNGLRNVILILIATMLHFD